MLSDDEIAKYCADPNEIAGALAREVKRLRDGIREHQAQTGHSICWLNDAALWKLLDGNPTYPHETLPVREEFLRNCQRFYESRLLGTRWEDPEAERTISDASPR